MRKTIQKFFLLALLAVFALPMQAQNEGVEAADTVGEKDLPTALFGFFSYNEVLEAMPDMTLLKKKMADQRSQYEAELKRAEEEFNKKYEEFLEGQRQFAPSIYKKRQAELTDLMERNMAFKAEAQKQLQEAEQAAMAPLKAKLSAAVAKVAKQMSLAFVLNTDGDAVPYVDPVLGTDITAAVKAALK
jgi:outer membrane protein